MSRKLTPDQQTAFIKAQEAGIKAVKERSRVKQEEYLANPRTCKSCNQTIPYEKRVNSFCSQSCSASFNNLNRPERSETSKKKTSKSIQDFNLRSSKTKSVAGIYEYTPIRFYQCEMCDSPFWSTFKAKHCRGECRTIAKSNGGKKSAAIRCQRSKDEIALYDLCKSHFKSVDHNVQIVNGWDADILIYDFKIAVLWDGPWHRIQMPHSNHSLEQVQNRDRIKERELKAAGWLVIRYADNEWTPLTAFENLVGLPGTDPSSISYELTASP